jgi:hypothetical protein
VPLTNFQAGILRHLASHRAPESYVVDATPLNRSALRYSSDIGVFHDREERVAAAALNDAKVLQEAGYDVRWLRQLPLVYSAEVGRGHESTRLEWVADSDFRFFPTMPDELFGYILPNGRALDTATPLDAKDVSNRLRKSLDEAEAFITRMPTAQMGLLFIQDGSVIQPDPDRLESYQAHSGQRRGHWPTNPEINAAIFARFQSKPPNL